MTRINDVCLNNKKQKLVRQVTQKEPTEMKDEAKIEDQPEDYEPRYRCELVRNESNLSRGLSVYSNLDFTKRCSFLNGSDERDQFKMLKMNNKDSCFSLFKRDSNISRNADFEGLIREDHNEMDMPMTLPDLDDWTEETWLNI